MRLLRPRYLIGLVALLFVVFEIYMNVNLRWHSGPIVRLVEDTPQWMEPAAPCAAPDKAELRKDELALEVFKTFSNWTGMKSAAFSYFDISYFRKMGELTQRVCANETVQAEFAALSVKDPYWRVGGFPGDHDIAHLRVARRIGPRFPQIVAIVAETAFAPNPIREVGSPTRDIRQLARVTLAEFGARVAAPWSDQAFDAIDASELGATAAQIAVVTRHPGALEKTSALLEEILRKYPTDPIPDHVWIRFYNLAFALAAAGTDAKPFIDPVAKIACRQIEAWAPPFGWLSISPSEMLRVLQIVGAEPCHAPH